MSNAAYIAIQQIPLAKIKPNPHNPRRVITQDMIDAMAASLKAVGLKNPIKVTYIADDDTYVILSGHIRRAGANQLGLETIPAIILDLAPEQALLEAILDNRGQQMSWLETYEAIESMLKLPSEPTQQEVANQLGLAQPTVNRAKRVMALLNPASRAQIYKLFIISDGYQPPEKTVYALTALDDPQKVEEALKVAIDKKMTEPQAKALVAHIQAGNPAEAHVPLPKTPKAAKAPKADSPEAVASTQAPPTPTASSSTTGSMSDSETVIWEGLAGMSLVARIKAKIKKGERPSLFEGLVLLADLLWRGFTWVAKHSWKVAKWLLKETWKSSKATLRMLGAKVLRIVGGVLGFVFLCFVLWFGWDAYEHGILHPFQEIGTVWAITHPSHADTGSSGTGTTRTSASAGGLSTGALSHPSSSSAPEGKLESPAGKSSASPQVTGISSPSGTQQPNSVAQPEVSPQTQTKKADPLDDLANTVAKQAGPGAAADAAKKIFGL